MHKNMTNREEAEWLKEWWKNYGQGIALAVIVGLIIGFGWRYYTNRQSQQAMAASNLYQQTQSKLGYSSAQSAAAQNSLNKQFSKTIYNNLSQFEQANQLVVSKSYQKALSILQQVSQDAKLPAIGQLARIRIAEIYLQLQKPQQALQVLQTVVDPSFAPMIASQQAQAYGMLKENDKAQAALQQAISGYDKLKLNTTLLKLNAGLQ